MPEHWATACVAEPIMYRPAVRKIWQHEGWINRGKAFADHLNEIPLFGGRLAAAPGSRQILRSRQGLPFGYGFLIYGLLRL